jgi:hypothetical protein
LDTGSEEDAGDVIDLTGVEGVEETGEEEDAGLLMGDEDIIDLTV